MQPPSINTRSSALPLPVHRDARPPGACRRLTVVRQPRRLPSVLSVEEVALLLQRAPGPKYRAAFATAYVPVCASPKSSPSRSATSTPSACCCGRAGQGSQGTATPCCPATARTATRMVARGRGSVHCWGGWLFPAAIRRALSTRQLKPRRSRRRRGRRDQRSGCRRIPCGTASPPTCSTGPDIRIIQVLLGHAKPTPQPVIPVSPTPRSAP